MRRSDLHDQPAARPPRRRKGSTLTGLIAFGAGMAVFAAANRLTAQPDRSRKQRRSVRYDTPERAMSRNDGSRSKAATTVGRTVTINRPRNELYAFWRDFTKLPQFMEDILDVEIVDDGHSRWTIAGPAGLDVHFVAEITEDRTDEVIAWQSDKDAPVSNRGRITFRDAPGGRGTIVDATIAYAAPGGSLGRMVARAFDREPELQTRRALMRFKQLVEAGEISTARTGAPARTL